MADLKALLIEECERLERAGSNITSAGQLMYGGTQERYLATVELAARNALDAVKNLRDATEGK